MKAPPTGQGPLLAIRALAAGYGQVRVLHDVDLAVHRGEIVALVGANGAGKSTLLRTISGLVRPAGGEIAFDGVRIDSMAPERIATLGLAHVPEGRRIFADQTTEDNLMLGAAARHGREKRSAIRAEVDAAFERFPPLAERRHGLAGFLSGGEQQMLAIARALMGRPRLLMLDEPSHGLAPIIVESVLALLEEEKRKGLAVLLVEQLAYSALGIADRGYVLARGRVALQGPASDLLDSADMRQAYLGGAAGG